MPYLECVAQWRLTVRATLVVSDGLLLQRHNGIICIATSSNVADFVVRLRVGVEPHCDLEGDVVGVIQFWR